MFKVLGWLTINCPWRSRNWYIHSYIHISILDFFWSRFIRYRWGFWCWLSRWWHRNIMGGTPGYVMCVFDLSMGIWRSFLSLITIRSLRLCRRCSRCWQSFLSRFKWFCRASVPLYLHFIWLNILFSWIGSDSNMISGILYHLGISFHRRLSSKWPSTHPLMYVCGMLGFILWFQIMGRGVGRRLVDDHSISSSISSLDSLVGRLFPSKNKTICQIIFWAKEYITCSYISARDNDLPCEDSLSCLARWSCKDG